MRPLNSANLTAFKVLSPVHGQQYAGDKSGLLRRQEQRRISHVSGIAHVPAQGHGSIPIADQVLPFDPPFPGR